MEFLTIILPVYNASSKLDECIKSLNNQSNLNFKCIFIDDKSTDDSIQKLQKSLIDSKFVYSIIMNDINLGPGGTRNRGLTLADTNYVMFLDIDDYIDLQTIEDIECILKSYQYDAVLFDYNIIGKIVLKKSQFSSSTDEGEVSPEHAFLKMSGSTLGKVYKREIISKNNLQFLNIIRNEDYGFNKTVISRCNKIYYLKKNLYMYVMHKDSLVHKPELLDFNNTILAFEYISKHIPSNFNDLLSVLKVQNLLISRISYMVLKKYSIKQIKEYTREYLKSNDIVFIIKRRLLGSKEIYFLKKLNKDRYLNIVFYFKLKMLVQKILNYR